MDLEITQQPHWSYSSNFLRLWHVYTSEDRYSACVSCVIWNIISWRYLGDHLIVNTLEISNCWLTSSGCIGNSAEIMWGWESMCECLELPGLGNLFCFQWRFQNCVCRCWSVCLAALSKPHAAGCTRSQTLVQGGQQPPCVFYPDIWDPFSLSGVLGHDGVCQNEERRINKAYL